MPRQAANELLDYLQSQAGEYLRGAVHYSDGGYEVLYLREDVARLYSDEKLAELSQFYRERKRERTAEEPFDLGNDHCTVQFYDEAILFHFMQGDQVGTVITLDPAAGRDIVEFITDCLRLLHAHSPQEIGDAPTWLGG